MQWANIEQNVMNECTEKETMSIPFHHHAPAHPIELYWTSIQLVRLIVVIVLTTASNFRTSMNQESTASQAGLPAHGRKYEQWSVL